MPHEVLFVFEQEMASGKVTGRGVFFTLGLISLPNKRSGESGTHMQVSVQIS